ncbi:hypothetical protein PR048_021579 [Dryococelus australis]|uniref:FP protein C-terminal domain-containing protein n=1 Tax=Dryococelus australis TaxID=614101 RepID=A0ABQ9GYK2_9NEOP|nr:hypothetical protein PR048_021579 [Dryococelus australis]
MPEVKKLDRDMEELKQYQRENNIEIHGIPQKKDEDVYKIIVDLSKELKILLTQDDIGIAHRLPSSKTYNHRPIILKLVCRWKKEEILKAKKSVPNLGNQSIGVNDFPNRKIYLNYNLTPYNKLLYKTARDLRPQIKFVWLKDCKMFIRKSENDSAVWIKSEEHLSDIKKSLQ